MYLLFFNSENFNVDIQIFDITRTRIFNNCLTINAKNLKLLIKFIIILKWVNQNHQLKQRQIKILLIFNLDETALFFKLPRYHQIKHRLEGIKQSKERLSIAFIVNALGT